MSHLRSFIVVALVAIFGWLVVSGLPGAGIPSRAATALVQTVTAVTGGSGASSLTATFTTTPVQNDLLIAVLGANGSTNIAPPSGWQTAVMTNGTVSQGIFYKIAGAAEPTAVTVNTSSSFELGLHIYEYSGISVSFPLDATSSAVGNNASTTGGTITTTQSNELLFAASAIAGQTSFSSWSNSFTSENSFADHTGGTRGTYGGADRIVTATGTYSTVGIAAAAGAWVGQIVSFRAQITFTQTAFRWFANTNDTSVGTPLAAQNSPMTQMVPGTPFRLRMLINVATNLLAVGDRSFALQYADEGTGTCASPQFPYATTTNASTDPIHFYTNTGATNGSPLTPTSTDPIDGTSTIVNQTYVGSNDFLNAEGAILVGQDGKWDFPLVDSSASSGATFCFRAVEANGTPFAGYAFYPAVVIGNVPPTVGPVTLNGNNNITLTIATTTPVIVTTTVSDGNGYTDIASATAMIYRTSLGPACVPDNNDCYVTPACSLSSCAGTTCNASCVANIWYFAQPTDANTPWSGDSWSATVNVSDHENATGTASSTGVSLLSLLGLQVATSINYGTFSPGQGMATLTLPVAIANVGNVSLNTTLYGTNMTSGSNIVAVGDQHYATSSIMYPSGTALLANPGTTIPLAIPKTTSTIPAGATFYWGIALPNPQSSGNFTGVNTFIAVENALPWP